MSSRTFKYQVWHTGLRDFLDAHVTTLPVVPAQCLIYGPARVYFVLSIAQVRIPGKTHAEPVLLVDDQGATIAPSPMDLAMKIKANIEAISKHIGRPSQLKAISSPKAEA